MKKVIILDFDGTIADNFEAIVNIAHKLTGNQKLTSPSEIRELKKLSLVKAAEQLEIPMRMWPLLLYRGRKLMAKQLNSIKLFDGMDNVIKSLSERGYRLYIMSNNSYSNIDRILINHGVRESFEKIYGGVGLAGKTSTLRKILDKSRLQPDEVIYVGDEVRDIEAAKAIEVPIVAVSWGLNDHKRLELEKPTKLVSTSKELLEAIESL